LESFVDGSLIVAGGSSAMGPFTAALPVSR